MSLTSDGGVLVSGTQGLPVTATVIKNTPFLAKLDTNGALVFFHPYDYGVPQDTTTHSACQSSGGTRYLLLTNVGGDASDTTASLTDLNGKVVA